MIARRTSYGLDSLLSNVLEFLSFQRCQPTRKTRESKACLAPLELICASVTTMTKKSRLPGAASSWSQGPQTPGARLVDWKCRKSECGRSPQCHCCKGCNLANVAIYTSADALLSSIFYAAPTKRSVWPWPEQKPSRAPSPQEAWQHQRKVRDRPRPRSTTCPPTISSARYQVNSLWATRSEQWWILHELHVPNNVPELQIVNQDRYSERLSNVPDLGMSIDGLCNLATALSTPHIGQ